MARFTVDPGVKSLGKCRKILAFVECHEGILSPRGISAHNPDLTKAKEWARQQKVSVGSESIGPICQVWMSRIANGLGVALPI